MVAVECAPLHCGLLTCGKGWPCWLFVKLPLCCSVPPCTVDAGVYTPYPRARCSLGSGRDLDLTSGCTSMRFGK